MRERERDVAVMSGGGGGLNKGQLQKGDEMGVRLISFQNLP